MGLFTRAKNMTPAERQAAADRWAIIGATLQDFGGSLRGGGSVGALQGTQDALMKRHKEQAAMEAQQAALANIQDPIERLVYATNPAKWAENVASNYAAANVNAGDTRLMRNGMFTAPKLVDDGGIYGTQTVGGYETTGARGPTISETETAKKNAQDYVTGITPKGFLPRLDAAGKVIGFDVDPNFKSFELQRAANSATRVNVPITLPAQNKFAEAFATQYAQDLSKARDVADTASDSMRTLQQAKGMLDKGMYTGSMADARLALGKLAAPLNPGIRDKVANTEAFQSVMGQQVLNIAKQLGSGTGISNADREFAAKVAGGSINLDSQTINRLIDIQERNAKNQIQRFQQRGAEAFQSVPSAQGLPQSAFKGPASAQQPANAPKIGEVRKGYVYKGGNPADPNSWSKQ